MEVPSGVHGHSLRGGLGSSIPEATALHDISPMKSFTNSYFQLLNKHNGPQSQVNSINEVYFRQKGP